MKEVIEVLTRQRKPLLAGAVTYQDLVNFGLIGKDGRALQDHGTNLNTLKQIIDAGTVDGALQSANNLGDVADVPTSQQNLELEPGVDVQPYDAQLSSSLPPNTITANTNIVAAHKAEALLMQGTTASQSVTIKSVANGGCSQGATVTIENFSNQNWGIALDGGVTLIWSPSGSSGARTLAVYGVATLHALFDDYWVVTGGGLS